MSNTATAKKNARGDLRMLVMQAVYEVMSDPDFGLDLTAKARKRLQAALRSKRKGIPFAEAERLMR